MDSVTKGIDHTLENKLKLGKNEAIQQVLENCKQQYKDNEIEKLAFVIGLCSDADDSSKYRSILSFYRGWIVKRYKIKGTNTIWDFALQRSWFNQYHEHKKIKVFCPCGRSRKDWFEDHGLVDFIQTDMRKRQLCRLSTFSSDEYLFQHVVEGKGYGSMVHLGLMCYLSILYEEEIKPPKKSKRVCVYCNIQLDITNCNTFCVKR